MFGTGFTQGWQVMDGTIRGQQELDLRRQEMAARQAAQQQEMEFRRQEFDARRQEAAEANKFRQQEFDFRRQDFQFRQQTEGRRSRLEAARMFNELVQMNPNATTDDLQALAGQVFGGMGMNDAIPGRDSLERMANALRSRQEAADQERQLALLERQLRTNSLLTQTASQYATMFGDPTEAYTAFRAATGAAGASMTPQAFSSLQRAASDKFVTDNLNLAITLAETGVPLKSQFQNASPQLLTALETRAKQTIEDRKRAEESKLLADEENRMFRAIQMGTPYTPSPNLPPQLTQGLMSQWEARSKEQGTKNFARFTDTIVGRRDFAVRLIDGDIAGVRSAIDSRAETELGRRLSAEEMERVLSDLTSVAGFEQSTRRTALMGEVDTKTTAAIEANSKQTRDQTLVLFEDKKTREEIFGSGSRGAVIAGTIKSLIEDQKFALNSSMVAEIGSRLQRDPQLQNADLVTPDMVRAAMQRDPEIARAIENAAPERVTSEARASARTAAGLFDTSTAKAYTTMALDRFERDAASGAANMRKEVTKILSDPLLPPEDKDASLAATLQRIDRKRAQLEAELQARLRPAVPWTQPGTPAFTPEDAARILDAYDASVAQARQIAEQARQAARANPTAPQGAAPAPQSRTFQPETLPRSGAAAATPPLSPEVRSRALDRVRGQQQAADEEEAAMALRSQAIAAARQLPEFQAIQAEMMRPDTPPARRLQLRERAEEIIKQVQARTTQP